MSEHASRKEDHLDLCSTDAVSFNQKTTLFADVQLIHDALPEMALSEVDPTTTLFGHTVRAPVVIAAMTGGVPRAEEVNRDLARVAEAMGLAFGFGSMRPLLVDPKADGYRVRDVAPTIPVLGNIGIVQARATQSKRLSDMLSETGCSALCVHLNPAMEIIQPNGDEDFRGGLETLERLRADLKIPIVVKETGCGLSRKVGQRLVDMGIDWVDTSGAGGTSWVGVETLRARARTRELGELFWDWGIPTAASVSQLSGLDLGIIATGGVSNGLDIARAVALGATGGGVARPILQAWNDGGMEGVTRRLEQIIDEYRFTSLLCGCRTPKELAQTSLVIGPSLRSWIPANSPLWSRIIGSGRR